VRFFLSSFEAMPRGAHLPSYWDKTNQSSFYPVPCQSDQLMSKFFVHAVASDVHEITLVSGVYVRHDTLTTSIEASLTAISTSKESLPQVVTAVR